MKRTGTINLARMRKQPARPPLKPLIAAIAGVSLTGCSDSEDVRIFTSLQDCTQALPNQAEMCETAYQQALRESAKTAPKFNTRADCEYEFGHENCEPYRAPGGQSWFMPAMAGFMLGQALDRDRDRGYYSSPLYRPFSYSSPVRGKWVTASGNVIGNGYSKRATVDADVFKPKPAVTRTISRGGFGSMAVAKSSWGGGRSSWGG